MKLYMQAGPQAGLRALQNKAWPARAFEIAAWPSRPKSPLKRASRSSLLGTLPKPDLELLQKYMSKTKCGMFVAC